MKNSSQNCQCITFIVIGKDSGAEFMQKIRRKRNELICCFFLSMMGFRTEFAAPQNTVGQKRRVNRLRINTKLITVRAI